MSQYWSPSLGLESPPQAIDTGDVLNDFDFDAFLHDDASGPTKPAIPAIHSTISQDRSNGITARAESNLQTLAKRAASVNLRSDPREQPPVPSSNFAPAKFGQSSRPSQPSVEVPNHPEPLSELHLDYQMQLNFLEHQNSRRLAESAGMMADEAYVDIVSAVEGHAGGLDEYALNNVPTKGLESSKLGKRPSNMKSSATARGSKRRSKRRRKNSSSDEDDAHKSTPTTNNQSRTRDYESYRVIYAIKCFESDPLEDEYHSSLLFEDCPERSGHRSMHFEGCVPMQSLVIDPTDETTGFVVYKEYHCIDPSSLETNMHLSRPKITESIWIRSQRLQSAFKSVALYTPTPSFGEKAGFFQTWRLTGPQGHAFLYHHRQRLATYAHNAGDETLRLTRALIHHFDDSWGFFYREMDRQVGLGTIDGPRLGYLFCRNEILVSVSKGVETAYVLRETKSPSSEYIELDCWAWGFDGFWWRRKIHSLTVSCPKSGPVPINSLPTYPLRFADAEVKNRLVTRGRRFWGFRDKCHVSYTGWDAAAEEFYSKETRCMIDYRTFKKFHPESSDLTFSYHRIDSFDPWPETMRYDMELSDTHMIIMPPTIHGFILKQKNWSKLLVDNIDTVTWNKSAFDQLVLRPTIKEMIKALIMVRVQTRSGQQNFTWKRDDLIAGKGNGLIMLLHGGPGTGKTLTAGNVAEIAEMPLYRVTCGEIGTTAEAVEKYLETILHLGKTWNCVLLLDEADVFLEERTMSDLDRNSLVSVFLRILEYYEGILILTTNRVGTFDEAFQSRIQIAIHYPTLDRPSRKRIWENFFCMLRSDGDDANVDELTDHIDELADPPMNGRQIRNILTTARQLAVYRRQTLSWSHVDQAMTTAKEFNRYLQNVHGHNDDQWARDEKIR
ncbi:hypothetical protein EDB80DRAFT_711244 [Ilyonectria destructans]|nr:hypothetical protein EDB80DRAFT_711244 [Ilyonectria destructans]